MELPKDDNEHSEDLGAQGAAKRAELEAAKHPVTYRQLTISKAISTDGDRKLSDLVRSVSLHAGEWAKTLKGSFRFSKWQAWYLKQVEQVWNVVYTGKKDRPKTFWTTNCGKLSPHVEGMLGEALYAKHPIRKLMCEFTKAGWIIPGHDQKLNKNKGMFSQNFRTSLQYLYKEWFPLQGAENPHGDHHDDHGDGHGDGDDKKHHNDGDEEDEDKGDDEEHDAHGHDAHGHGTKCVGDFIKCGDRQATIAVLEKLSQLAPKEDISFAGVTRGSMIEVRVSVKVRPTVPSPHPHPSHHSPEPLPEPTTSPETSRSRV